MHPDPGSHFDSLKTELRQTASSPLRPRRDPMQQAFGPLHQRKSLKRNRRRFSTHLPWMSYACQRNQPLRSRKPALLSPGKDHSSGVRKRTTPKRRSMNGHSLRRSKTKVETSCTSRLRLLRVAARSLRCTRTTGKDGRSQRPSHGTNKRNGPQLMVSLVLRVNSINDPLFRISLGHTSFTLTPGLPFFAWFETLVEGAVGRI